MLWFGHLSCTRAYLGSLTLKQALWSVAPDLPMVMFLTGPSSWKQIKETFLYTMLYKIPHSFLSTVFVPSEYRAIYAGHIFLDIISHTGEWSIQPFFPLNTTIHGLWNPIAWN